MWELASAIKIGSHLPDKDKVGSELMALGDMSRDLSDEISYVPLRSLIRSWKKTSNNPLSGTRFLSLRD
jgi:hypothetical protein